MQHISIRSGVPPAPRDVGIEHDLDVAELLCDLSRAETHPRLVVLYKKRVRQFHRWLRSRAKERRLFTLHELEHLCPPLLQCVRRGVIELHRVAQLEQQVVHPTRALVQLSQLFPHLLLLLCALLDHQRRCSVQRLGRDVIAVWGDEGRVGERG